MLQVTVVAGERWYHYRNHSFQNGHILAIAVAVVVGGKSIANLRGEPLSLLWEMDLVVVP